jgi:hypothetical protein
MPRTCVLLPHGPFSLLTAALTTMGWLAALFENSCNYALVSGDVVDEVSITPVPFIQVGLDAYRLPHFDTDSQSWHASRTGECIRYPSTVDIDGIWKLSNAFSFVGLVLGGGATFYLWISTFCRFSRGSWRWAGYEIAAACLFQALSFVWYATDLCQQNHCSLSNGAKADILAATFWLVAATLVFAHYPIPRELVAADGIMHENSENSRGSSQRSTQRRRSPRPVKNTPDGTAVAPASPPDEEMATGENSQQEASLKKKPDLLEKAVLT